jgi:hypothetical protein
LRRLLRVLALAALMAAMMVSAGPAMARDSFGNESDFNNGWDVVQYNDGFFVSDDAWDFDEVGLEDCFWWDGEYWCEVDF